MSLEAKCATVASLGKGGAGKLPAIGVTVIESVCYGYKAGASDVDTIGFLTFKTPGTSGCYAYVSGNSTSFETLEYGAKATSLNSSS